MVGIRPQDSPAGEFNLHVDLSRFLPQWTYLCLFFKRATRSAFMAGPPPHRTLPHTEVGMGRAPLRPVRSTWPLQYRPCFLSRAEAWTRTSASRAITSRNIGAGVTCADHKPCSPTQCEPVQPPHLTNSVP